MKGIILHGGHGTRLRPLTHTGPKQLLPIANKPMSQYCVESLIDAGISEICIIIGGIGANKVKEYYGNGERFGAKITYIEQDYPRGIAHAIGLCRDFVKNEKFVVFLGDNIIQKSIRDFVKEFEGSEHDATVLLCKVDNPSRFGIAELENGIITKIIEKPKNPKSDLAVTGIYLLTPKIFQIIDSLKPSWRNELEITDALDALVQQKYKISYHIITDYWKDTGTPEDIIHANNAILEKMEPYFYGKKEHDVSIRGNIMVSEGTIIKKGVILEGPVIIGRNCVIESDSHIGPNVSIGDDSEIKAKISDSIVMSGCHIDCNFDIKNSIIAFNSEIVSDHDKMKIFLLGEGTRISL
jgi:glucose-1-phosphate thymidylyltransferase